MCIPYTGHNYLMQPLSSEQLVTLLIGLPSGEAQYVRNRSGAWDVKIFAPGTVDVRSTVATNMDKSVACWLMHTLNAALEMLHKRG